MGNTGCRCERFSEARNELDLATKETILNINFSSIEPLSPKEMIVSDSYLSGDGEVIVEPTSSETSEDNSEVSIAELAAELSPRQAPKVLHSSNFRKKNEPLRRSKLANKYIRSQESIS